jgi:urease accessory protein
MIAELDIQVKNINQQSVVVKSYCTTPFKLLNITEDKSKPGVDLMLMSSSPGILNGDAYTLAIKIDVGAQLRLHTQAYQRLFTMQESATQTMEVYVENEASFIYLPHPTVPHKASSFTNYNTFHLQQTSRLVFGEILTCGRKLNDEQFSFSSYQSITSVYMQDKLVIKENLFMAPASIAVEAIGQLEGYTHQASLLCINSNVVVEKITASIIDVLQQQQNIVFGVSATPVNGVLVKVLGNGAEQLYECLQILTRELLKEIF